jgi:DNA-binding response OmpR family regulator
MMEQATVTRNVNRLVLSAWTRADAVKDGTELGARTLDILIELVSRPNEVVSKNDLLARVWPDVIVEEGSLRFHIVSPHKALGLHLICEARDTASLSYSLRPSPTKVSADMRSRTGRCAF